LGALQQFGIGTFVAEAATMVLVCLESLFATIAANAKGK
jgi:hypothetical protein